MGISPSEFWSLSFKEYIAIHEAYGEHVRAQSELQLHVLQTAIANSFGKKRHKLFGETEEVPKENKKANRAEFDELVAQFT